jgi:hypothetical protein
MIAQSNNPIGKALVAAHLSSHPEQSSYLPAQMVPLQLCGEYVVVFLKTLF